MEAISYQNNHEENKENLHCSNHQSTFTADEDAIVKPSEQRYLSFEELEPIEMLSQTDNFVAQVQSELKSEEWTAQYDTLNVLRRLNKFHWSDLMPHLELLTPLIAEAVESLRSNISKNALLLVTEMFSFKREDGHNSHIVNYLIPVVFLKSINDKQFISLQAQRALSALSEFWLYEETLICLKERCEEKNARISVKAAEYLLKTVANLGEEFKNVNNVNNVLLQFTDLLNIKRADTHRQVKKLFLKLQSIYGAASLMQSIESFGDSDITAKVKEVLRSTTKKTAGRGGFRAFLQRQKSAVVEDSQPQVVIKNPDN